jgi:hypothetical protein
MSGIEPVQEYNEYIKRQLLDAIQRGVVGALPQPTMFGGKRMRNFVLPSSTEYDYPSSLSVGHLGASQPDMLGGSFWDDFGKGFKQGVSGVAQVAMPIVKEVGTELAKDAIRSYAKGSGRRRKKGAGGYSFGNNGVMYQVHPPNAIPRGGFLVGRDGMIRPQAEGGYIGMTGNPYNESGFGSPNTQLDNFPKWGGAMCGAGVWDSFKSGFTQVGNAIAPIAKEVFHDVVVPEGKEYLKQQIKERKEKGGSKNSALIAKMIGNQRKAFKIDRVSRPSGNAINYAKKVLGQTYKGKKPSDMWNTYKGEARPQEPPKKRGRKPKAPVASASAPVDSDTGNDSESDEEEPQNVAVAPINPAKGVKGRKPRGRPPKKGAKGTADIRGFFQPRTSGSGRGGALVGGDILGDLGKVSQAVAPFLPLLMGLGRGDPLPPHPHGGNWADDLGKVSQAIAPFAPLLLGLGRGKMPSKYAINKVIKGGNWLDDLGKVSQAIAPFAPLLMGLGRGGNWADDLGKVSQAIAPFAPLLMGLGRKKRGGSLSGMAVRHTPMVGADGHGILPFQPVSATPSVGSGRKKGGVMIMDDPSQFHINTGMMPPALASYNPPVPSVSGKGKGGVRKQLPHSGKKRESARGAIVAEVMKKHGLNLAQASKFVKEHGLY